MRLPVRTLAELVAWSFERDAFTGRRPIVAALPFLVMTLGAGCYVAITTGRVTGSTVALALAGGTLSESVRHLYNAVRALFAEPQAGEKTIATGRRRKELEREKAALLKAIKELEFDHEMRKVSDHDFAEIGGNYRARAIRVIRQLDRGGNDYEAMVREEVSKVRRGAKRIVADGEPIVVSEVVATPVPKVLTLEVRDAGCPACGTSNDADAIFCKKCATRLSAKEGTA